MSFDPNVFSDPPFHTPLVISGQLTFFNSTEFISIQDGVKPHFKCPNLNCGYEFIGNKQNSVDINELVYFKCPQCGQSIALFIATNEGSLTIRRSDEEGGGSLLLIGGTESGIPSDWRVTPLEMGR